MRSFLLHAFIEIHTVNHQYFFQLVDLTCMRCVNISKLCIITSSSSSSLCYYIYSFHITKQHIILAFTWLDLTWSVGRVCKLCVRSKVMWEVGVGEWHITIKKLLYSVYIVLGQHHDNHRTTTRQLRNFVSYHLRE